MSEDIQKIAEGLSATQCVAIKILSNGEARSTSSAYMALVQRKLARYSRSEPTYSGVANFCVITPLGQQVRAYLQGKQS